MPEWGEVFDDPVVTAALLDRLLHHAVVIQIERSSYRLRQHADLVPEHIRAKPSPPHRPTRNAAGDHQNRFKQISIPGDHR
jgi:hypothetical protein